MKGVSFDKARNRWVARRREYKKTVTVGRYITEDEAIAALSADAKPLLPKPRSYKRFSPSNVFDTDKSIEGLKKMLECLLEKDTNSKIEVRVEDTGERVATADLSSTTRVELVLRLL